MLFSHIKNDCEPDTLANICLECICTNLSTIFSENDFGFHLHPSVLLPRELCEAWVEVYQRTGHTIDDRFANLFGSKRQTPLQKVTIWNSTITDEGLNKMLQYNLRELDLAYCKNLTSISFDLINQHGHNLKSLSVGCDVNIINNSETVVNDDTKNRCSVFLMRGYVLNTPNLTRLILKDVRETFEPTFYETLLISLPRLMYLDLSCCKDLGDLSYISNCPNLVSLTLFNCANLQKAIPYICQLKKLKWVEHLLRLTLTLSKHLLWNFCSQASGYIAIRR